MLHFLEQNIFLQQQIVLFALQRTPLGDIFHAEQNGGAGAPFVTALANLARWSPVLPALGGGATRFQPLWIEDLVTCLVAAITRDELLGAAHALGGAEILTFREVLQTIAAALEKRRLILPVPLAIARLQAQALTALLPKPPLTPAAIELFSFENATDLDSVERRFQFQPKGFREQPLP